MKRMITLFILMCATLMLSNAQGQGRGKKDASRDSHRPSIVFTSHDRDIIRDYFRDRYSNLPPGLAKRGGQLPPGLQKQLDRNGTLPPGLQKRVEPFPEDLERRLPSLPSIYRRGTIGSDVVILDTRTQRIMDVIYDIFGPR
ncbi:MAG TPA: hypothetical protein VF493_19475 [Terriglobales bacterium]